MNSLVDGSPVHDATVQYKSDDSYTKPVTLGKTNAEGILIINDFELYYGRAVAVIGDGIKDADINHMIKIPSTNKC